MINWAPLIPPPVRSRFFVSHRSLQHTLAAAVEDALRAADQEVWRDRGKLHTGDNWPREIRQAIEDCDDLVVLITPEAAESEHVRTEIETAVALGKRVHGFSTFDIQSSRFAHMYVPNIHVERVPPKEEVRMSGDLKGFGRYVVETMLKPERKPHPLDLRDFERRACRTLFPPFRDLCAGSRLNRSLIQQYTEYGTRLSADAARRTPAIALNAGILLMHQRQWQQASEHLQESVRLHSSGIALYFSALAALRGTRPRHVGGATTDQCVALARQSWEQWQSPLIALLLVLVLWDSGLGRGRNLATLCNDALGALRSVETPRDEVARFLSLAPLEEGVDMPFDTRDILNYLFELTGEAQ